MGSSSATVRDYRYGRCDAHPVCGAAFAQAHVVETEAPGTMLSYKEYDNALAVEIVIKGFVSTKEFEDAANQTRGLHCAAQQSQRARGHRGYRGHGRRGVRGGFQIHPAPSQRLSRCAIVSDGKWVTPWSEIVAPFFKGEVRYFPPAEIEAAREWLLFPGDRDKT